VSGEKNEAIATLCNQRSFDTRQALELQDSEGFRQIADNLQVVFAVSNGGLSKFLYVNRTYEDIWGRPVETLYAHSRSFLESVHKDDKEKFEQALERLIQGEPFTDLECRVIRPDGSLVWVSCRGYPVRNAQGEIYRLVGSAQEITKRKLAEDRLRESEDRYRDLVEHSHDLICTHDLQGVLLSVNDPPLRILGYSREELLNKPMRDFVPPEARPHCDAYLVQIRRDGFAKGLLPVLTKAGEVRLWEFNNSLRTEGVSSPVVRGLAHDVTEQKRAERELRRVTRLLLQLQDEERHKIARDLHDTTGQNLAAVLTLLDRIQRSIRLSKTQEAWNFLSECQKLAKQSLDEIRTLSYGLFPPHLDEAGLEGALRHHVNGFMERTGIRIELQVSPHLDRMPQDVELAVFRVVQEGLVNIQRHSQSRTAKVWLTRKPGMVVLEISDRGKGMPGQEKNAELAPAAGVGIPSMTERVRLVGGELNIESKDIGTTIRVRIPLNESKCKETACPAGG